MKSDKTYQIFFLTFFGTLGSILVGLIFFSTLIFVQTTPSFQFIVAGLYGSLFFSLLEYRTKRDQIFAVLFMFFLHVIIFSGRHVSLSYFLRDVFYLCGLFLSVKAYHLFIKKNFLKFYLRTFVLVFFYTFINTLLITILFIINSDAELPGIGFIYYFARGSALIGLGTGFGLDFYLQNQSEIFKLFKIKIA